MTYSRVITWMSGKAASKYCFVILLYDCTEKNPVHGTWNNFGPLIYSLYLVPITLVQGILYSQIAHAENEYFHEMRVYYY